jgi:hypothetical protein
LTHFAAKKSANYIGSWEGAIAHKGYRLALTKQPKDQYKDDYGRDQAAAELISSRARQ